MAIGKEGKDILGNFMKDLNARYKPQPEEEIKDEPPKPVIKRPYVPSPPYDPIAEINQPPEILDKIKAYVANPKGFLVLAGLNGTGKSFAAEKIMASMQIRDTDFRKMITQADLNMEWQHQIKEWGDTLYLIKRYWAFKCLVIDDLGTRIPTDAFMDFLYSVTDKRWQMRDYLSTIITTNLNSKDMRAKYGDAFTSRICSGEIIKFEGGDRRIIEF